MAEPPLPPGWQMKRTPEGRAYYIDHNTRKTQWDPPVFTAQPVGATVEPSLHHHYTGEAAALSTSSVSPSATTEPLATSHNDLAVSHEAQTAPTATTTTAATPPAPPAKPTTPLNVPGHALPRPPSQAMVHPVAHTAPASTTTTTGAAQPAVYAAPVGEQHHPTNAAGRVQFIPTDPRMGFSLNELVMYAREIEGDPAQKPVFSLSNDRVLEVQMRNEATIFCRRGSMHAYRGKIKFVREGMGDTGVKLYLQKAVTGETPNLMKATGTGRLWIGHGGKKVVIMHLNDEAIIVNGHSILAFENTLHYSVVMLKSGSWLSGGLFNLKISGTGALAITTHFDPMVFAVTPEMELMTDPESTVAWSSSLEPKLKSCITFKTVIGKGSGETFQLKFQGTGFVISQPVDELGFGNEKPR